RSHLAGETSQSPSPLKGRAAMLVAVPLTLLMNVVTFFVLHGVVPRTNEGIRRTIALPWAWYAMLAHAVPPLLAVAICCLYWRSPRHRLLIAFLAGLTEFLWYQYSGGHLLRRDWIGKF